MRIEPKERAVVGVYERDKKYAGMIGKVIHICPDWYLMGVPFPHYKLRLNNGEVLWWVDENDLTVVGFVTT